MRLGITAATVCVLTSALSALPEPGPGFDPRAVVRQVRQARRNEGRSVRGPRRANRHAMRQRRPSPVPAARPDDDEFLVDTSAVLVPGPYDRTLPAVAFDGTNFLVVWEDDRGFDWCYDIYGARVTPSGTVLDPAGIAISEAIDDQNCPAVSFDGTSFLVVWEDWRSDEYQDIYGTRVTPGGVVLDPGGLLISQQGSDQYSAAVGSGGGNSLVVWVDFRTLNSEDVYGARVTPQGEVLDPAGIPISQADKDQCYPAVGFDSANFLVVWEEYRNLNGDVYGARVTPQGEVLDPAGIVIATAANGQYCPALSFVGGNYLVAWEDYRNGSDFEVYGARVTPAGTVLDPSGLAIVQTVDDQYYVKVGSDSANFLVVWEDYRGSSADVYGARVTPGGTVLDASGFAISDEDDQYTPAVGFGGGNFLVAWEDYGIGDVIYGGRVTPAGTVLDPGGFIVSTTPQDQYSPAVAFDGTNFLVVWEDGRSVSWYENYDIYGARVTPQGAVLDPSGFAVTQAPGDQYDPAVGFNGTDFLVVWDDYRNGYQADIYGARVTQQGTVLDTVSFVISAAAGDQSSADVSGAGANFVVVWEDRRSSSYCDVYGSRVTQQGEVLDPSGIVIAQAAYSQSAPAVGSDGANALVVWQDNRSGSGWYDVRGARVTPEGTVLDSAGIAISQAAYHQQAPDVSFDGANFFVVWEDVRSAVSWDIYGARVTPAGAVLDSGLVVSQAAGDQGFPAVGFDDTNFLVVWEDFRNGVDWDIYGARVTPQGVVSDSWPVSVQERDQWPLALACGGGGQLLTVYQSWTRSVGGKGYNTHRIWGRIGAFVGIDGGSRPRPADGRPSAATVVSRVLFVPGTASLGPRAASLLDVSGQIVLELHAGANDVSRLSPGVYFVREEPQAASQEPQAVRKTVITR